MSCLSPKGKSLYDQLRIMAELRTHSRLYACSGYLQVYTVLKKKKKTKKKTRIVVQGQLVKPAVCLSYGQDKLNL